MIVIGPDHVVAEAALPTRIGAADLLAACAAEAGRQAATMSELDTALGTALQMLRAMIASGEEGRGRATLVSALIADLQMADRLRQESEGLARALEMLAGLSSLNDQVPAEDIRACTPFAALQERLLAPPKRAPSGT